MNAAIGIRDETDADAGTITEVTVAAFNALEISNHTEQFIVGALRAAKALTVSLVAEVDGRVVGHIAFSPVIISDGSMHWYGLGPLSVLPELQRMGIGKALIREGLTRLKALNAQGCCLVGHPDYYRRSGFASMPGLVHEEVPREVFLALALDGPAAQGTVTFHEGFRADGRQARAGDLFSAPDLARQMQEAQRAAGQIEPFSSRVRDFDLPAAYAVADLIHRERVRQGARPVGRKIGFANPAMWAIYGVREPIWAHVYDSTVVHVSGGHTEIDGIALPGLSVDFLP